ncbi:S1 family peptidase [Streptomyces profundus]|uniref:S1 family peptidase n=1 Tax=Streptomyces profundus TaxID=2867410 RepID=UPI001D16960E|nr:S1 family peptidase [Streptomyces sp. MA3_2.13]UED84423.1 S1 family peptidase [Streptomyces sp. MA3_2.13]
MTGTATNLAPGPGRRRAAQRTLVGTVLGALLIALALALAPTASAAPATPATDTASVTAADAIRGGDRLHSAAGPCTVAFNATDGTDRYGLMAGHCGGVGTQWYRDPALTVPVAVTTMAVFPGSSWSVVRYTNPDLEYPSELNGGGQPVRITGAASPSVGQSACRYGSTTGIHCGTVTGVNQTIAFPDGTVNGLFTTNICAEPGDQGGPVHAASTALGILVGGSGNCASGGQTYYQPVSPVLAAAGLSVGY